MGNAALRLLAGQMAASTGNGIVGMQRIGQPQARSARIGPFNVDGFKGGVRGFG